MVSESKLKKYAALAVRVGANVQKGQLLVIRSSVDTAFFARLCMKEAYQAGAGKVMIRWTDEQSEKIAYEQEETASMEKIFPWELQREQDFIDHKYAYLAISSSTPGLLGHISSEKLQAVKLAREEAFEKFDYYFSANHGQWSIVAIPTMPWAKKVFPQYDDQKALDALWDAVLMSVRITDDNDPVAEWKKHNQNLKHNSEWLNQLRFKSLHFVNALGTDLTVPLVQGHIWVGGGSEALDNGAIFNPNMPTEEVFCMPEKCGAEGIVYASKPLNYQGKMIRDFWFRFVKGKVVDYGAKEGKDVLKNLVEFDEGSSYLGEVALISNDSPISNSGVLFLSTLFDENASCHLALGDSYPENLEGGVTMSREERQKHGANYSKEHCDFMFGSADMRITGLTQGGRSVPVFEKGNFVASL